MGVSAVLLISPAVPWLLVVHARRDGVPSLLQSRSDALGGPEERLPMIRARRGP